MRKSTKNQIYIFVLISVILLVIVPVVGYFNTVAVEAKQENGAIGQTKPNPALFTNAPPGFSGLLLNASITTIDIPAFRYQLHLEVGPKGGLASTDNLGRITRSLQLWINGKVTPIQAGQPAFPMDIPISFESGSVNMYPIDSFHSTLKIYAFLVDNSTATNTPIPVALIFAGALQSWTIKSSLEIQENEMNLKIKVIRSATTIFFSIFIILVMWALSLTLLILAVTLWMRKRKVEPPTMSVAAALLFALPSIRSTQPGIPSIGCTADAMGFLWNMALIAISVLLLMWNYIVNYKKEKKTEEDVIRPLVRSESPPVPYYYPDTPKKETPMNATPMYETKRPQPAQHKTYYI